MQAVSLTFFAASCALLLVQLEAEQAIPQAERFYCPKPECSALLLLPASGSAASLAGPSACPECRTRVCLACKVVWHANMSCRQYQVGCENSRGMLGWGCAAALRLSSSGLPVSLPAYTQPTLESTRLVAQALPAGMKQPEELALLEAAQAKNWRSCPSCR